MSGSPMHVLVTADTVGGVWTYARELVCGLVRRGVRVTLVSFGEIPTPAQTEWMEGLKGLDYRPTAFRLEWMQESEEDLGASSEYLLTVIEESKPDLLHFNQFCYGALPISLPSVVVAHSDVVSWWLTVKGELPRDVSWMDHYREVVSAGLRGAAAVVAPTRWMLDQIEEIYGRPKRSSVIYNGRSPLLFTPHMTKEDYVLSVGRVWDAGKQVSLLREFEPSLPVHIVGVEEHADKALRSEGNRDGHTSLIDYKGAQTEGQLRHWFGRAAMYAATSRYEPFGLAPLEAALSRCAIIANDIPSFREVWGSTAYYFSTNDAQGLASAIEHLNSDRQLRLTYANLAYNRARQRFTAERMVDDYLHLYQSVVPAGVLAA